MADATVDQIAAQNAALAAQNQQLMERIAALESRIPAPEPEPIAPGVRLEFPRMLYRDENGNGRIDVPDNETRIVNNQAELEAALVDGWDVSPIAAKPVKKAKK